MIVPDSNLLLHAYNAASASHAAATDWWEQCLSGREPIGLVHPVIFAFVRVGTSTRAFSTPLTLQEAWEVIDEWLDRSITRILPPAGDHVERVMTLLEAAGSAGGNLVTDAQIAALAIAHNAAVHTADYDFLRFKGLKCRFPLEAPAHSRA
jgi:toxin-antitoxin system PIN domain toxin